MILKKEITAGVDESGRGPLFGPVVSCCVVFNDDLDVSELKDSKKISPIKRFKIFNKLIQSNIDYGIGIVNEDEIDKINILNATKKSMLIAINSLKKKPTKLLIDGNQPLNTDIMQRTIVKGDEKIAEISAASIIAKVTRDKIIESYSKIYPFFELTSNKGYGTKRHLEFLEIYGATSIHRKSFKPVVRYSQEKLSKFESQIITKFAIDLIKKGIDIVEFSFKNDLSFIRYFDKGIDNLTISVKKKHSSSLLQSFIKKNKEKDSVMKVRLNVIYSDDTSSQNSIRKSFLIR